MLNARKLGALVALLVVIALVAVGCKSAPEVVEVEVTREVIVEVEKEVTVEVEAEVTRIVEQEVIVEVEAEPAAQIPFAQEWVGSGHADTESESFAHWDEDDPAVVPGRCAKCHSTGGYLDFLGEDGTEYGVVDNDAESGTVIECIACHNEATMAMASVVFPSGVEVTGLGDDSRCMQCHQGRASTVTVDEAIAGAGVDDDTASEDLSFANIHYYAAAATKYGGVTMGGYQYAGQTYDAVFTHVEGYDTCFDCHDPHSLELKLDECATCHAGVSSVEDLKDLRWVGSTADYDGDGNLEEGVAYEIEGLQEILYAAIQAYGENAGAPIVYDLHRHPYFFVDSNGNGQVDEGEGGYNVWTPRLLRAAYNYQTSLKDPGAYAHGGKYIIELLYDSIADLDAALAASLNRVDAGHFDGSSEGWRHWDEDGEVSASCARCHSATGLPLYIAEGVNVSEPLSNGMLCSTCHDAMPAFTRYPVEDVTFPSGAALDTGSPDSNLCLNCHQGRESTVSVNRAIAGMDLDTVSDRLSFRNVHYFAAGATLFGSEAKGAYEYEGQEYVGRFAHVSSFENCVQCHDAHGLALKEEACGTCHAGVEDVHDIRMDAADYDGDGDTEEGIGGEIETLHEALYEAMQSYAADVAGTAIAYDSHRHPYFFVDSNGNGEVDEGESDRYAAWTPRLLQAAYNYQYVAKDPGAYAHNAKYIIQVLYDSLSDLGAATASMVRP